MAYIAARQGTVFHLAQRALAPLFIAFGAVGYFLLLIARANEMQPLMDASEEDLAARGMTRQHIVDYIIKGFQPR